MTTPQIALLVPPPTTIEQWVVCFIDRGKSKVWQYSQYCPILRHEVLFALLLILSSPKVLATSQLFQIDLRGVPVLCSSRISVWAEFFKSSTYSISIPSFDARYATVFIVCATCIGPLPLVCKFSRLFCIHNVNDRIAWVQVHGC